MKPSEQHPKMSVSFSGSSLPKLSLSPAINFEHASWLVVMDTDSLGEREPKNKTNEFDRSSLVSFPFHGLSGSL